MMQNNGLIGLLQVVHGCARAGFGRRRAWTVVGVTALILMLPLLLLFVLLWVVSLSAG